MSETFSKMAALLAYPEPDYRDRLDACLRAFEPAHDGGRCLAPLQQFRAVIEDLDIPQLQELFIQTFDLNPVCSLEMGWHLFGENYDRGLLLVRMRRELRRHGLVEASELPDHLSHALLLLDRMERETAADFAAAIVLPALAKMLQAMKGKLNPFENILLAAEQALRGAYPEIPAMAAPNQPPLRVLA